jgi:ABC-2 type transport system permease protein
MIARTYALESKFELFKLLRLPTYAFATLGFPLMFYGFFGLMYGSQHVEGTTFAKYLLATYGAFGVIGASLFGFGVSIAVERGQGWLLLKRASPMPPLSYFFAKVVACSAFCAIIVAALFVMGAFFGGVHLVAVQWALLAAALLAGALPFCAIGLAIGTFAGPNGAPGIVNMINLPMAFLSGLWIPIAQLPPAVQHIAPWLPAYHLAQLALGALGSGSGPWYIHVIVLLAYTSVALSLAAVAFRRDEGRTYG